MRTRSKFVGVLLPLAVAGGVLLLSVPGAGQGGPPGPPSGPPTSWPPGAPMGGPGNPVIAKGMTWARLLTNPQTGTISVGCGTGSPNACNASIGDTICEAHRPVLCIYKPSPAFPVPVGVNNSSVYNRWSGGVIATTAPIAGVNFLHRADVNTYCKNQFGPGWRVAEFHDGWGWGFQAYGGTTSAPPPGDRFWVDINDQQANCWKP